MRRLLAAFTVVPVALLVASRSEYLSVKSKFDSIEHYRLKPGARVPIGANELNAYVETELPKHAPPGVRAPRVELHGDNTATGYAKINFLTLRKSQGVQPNWFMRKLLDGERDVAVTSQVESGGGKAIVHLRRVEIGGIPIEGSALDFLIEHYLIPNYPSAKIGRPIELGYGMDRFEVKPGRVEIVMSSNLRRPAAAARTGL